MDERIWKQECSVDLWMSGPSSLSLWFVHSLEAKWAFLLLRRLIFSSQGT